MSHGTQLPLLIVDPRIPGPHIIERFWSKVNTSGECWLWTACKTSDGYGGWSYKHDGRVITMRAHRFAFLVTYQRLTEGLVLHHTCGVQACVRPDHLIEMSQAEHLSITPGTYVNIWGIKTHCKHGHELSGDNLMPGSLRHGFRQCKACVTRRNAEARAKHPEKLRDASRSYKERNLEKVRERDRAYRARKRQPAPS